MAFESPNVPQAHVAQRHTDMPAIKASICTGGDAVEGFEIPDGRHAGDLLFPSPIPSYPHSVVGEHARDKTCPLHSPYLAPQMKCMTRLVPQDLELTAVYPIHAFNTDWLAFAERRAWICAFPARDSRELLMRSMGYRLAAPTRATDIMHL